MAKHEIIRELEAFKEEFQKKARTALNTEFKEFFAAHPQVERIVWTQYTPYFNDGDTCEFSVNEPVFLGTAPTDSGEAAELLEEDEDDSEAEEEGGGLDVLEQIRRQTEGYTDYNTVVSERPSTWGRGYPTEKEYAKVPPSRKLTKEDEALQKDASALESLVTGLDETMKDIFGDHVKVTARKGGFEVSEYEHE